MWVEMQRQSILQCHAPISLTLNKPRLAKLPAANFHQALTLLTSTPKFERDNRCGAARHVAGEDDECPAVYCREYIVELIAWTDRLSAATSRQDHQVQRVDSAPQADSLQARQLAADAVQRFLMSWRKAWLASETERLRAQLAPSNPNLVKAERTQWRREVHVRCPAEGYDRAKHTSYIVSANNGFGKCPSWLLSDISAAVDEADVHDAGISPARRTSIQSDRAGLIRTLESLQRQAPGEVFNVGQLVRFLVDADQLEDAVSAATQCTADPLWCRLLLGCALASRGRDAAADSTFELVSRLMPRASRCEWTDIETPRATLVTSTAPDSVVIVGESPASSSGRVGFSGEIISRSMLIGVESVGTRLPRARASAWCRHCRSIRCVVARSPFRLGCILRRTARRSNPAISMHSRGRCLAARRCKQEVELVCSGRPLAQLLRIRCAIPCKSGAWRQSACCSASVRSFASSSFQ